MYSIYFCDTFAFNLREIDEIKTEIYSRLNLSENDYYILQNGRKLQASISENVPLHVIPKLIGGKGGFGSMLRAIGAQIEKTTNREACRDLSGRRLRDINEEKRLKTWIEQQVEREKEAKDRKQKKLERLVQIPKHVFKDENYEKDRSALPDMVEDALEQGLKASTSIGNKRTHEDDATKSKKKKPKLWLESDEDLSSSDDDSKKEDSCSSSNSEKKDEQKHEDSCSSSNSEKKEEKSSSSNDEQKQDEIIEIKN